MHLKTMTHWIIPIVLILKSGYAQNRFPLIGQTWVLINGPTERTHIVKSITNFAPSKVLVVNFISQSASEITIDVRWASLEGIPLRSTSEAIDSAYSQLKKNFSVSKNLAYAYYNPFPDTSYSCEPQLRKLFGAGFRHYVVNDQDIDPRAAPTLWYPTPPSCYASRSKSAGDVVDNMACEGEWCATLEAQQHHEVCHPTRNECRSYIDEDAMTTHVENQFYWNLHIFPKIVYHPRHHATGRIMTEVSMDAAQAETAKKNAIANPGLDNLKPYLNPILDDSASVFFSGQFRTPASGAQFVSLDIPAIAPGGTTFTHDPAIMYRISSMPGPGSFDRSSTSDLSRAIQAALLRPFAKNTQDDQFIREIDTRCPTWRYYDDDLGKNAFAIRNDVTATLPDALPADPYDSRWKVQVKEGDNTYLRDARTLDNQMAIVRNRDIIYSDYWWKGCPEKAFSSFKMTKKQLLDFITEPVPTCNLIELQQSVDRIYGKIYSIFRADRDENEATLAYRRMSEADFQVKRFGSKIHDFKYENCPETTVSQLLRRMP
jgi:hypothetical protein